MKRTLVACLLALAACAERGGGGMPTAGAGGAGQGGAGGAQDASIASDVGGGDTGRPDSGLPDAGSPEVPPDASPAIVEGSCVSVDGGAPDFLARLGCRRDFDLLSSAPLDSSLPGARSVKVVLDQADGDKLHFQNSSKYQIHHQFASAHLSGNGLPFVATLAKFNETEYYAPDRRFILGAVTHYEGPNVWVVELAPYDTASPAMITKLYAAVKSQTYFGPALAFHPTSQIIERTAQDLTGVRLVTTDELYAGTDYQPLNLGSSIGRLRFVSAADLATTYLSFRDIVVLDHVPNDISVVMGIITEEFQTPLSHVNVLSQNRKTPNMGLRRATTNPQLRALEGRWVKLTVGAQTWTVEEVTMAEADAFWETRRPKPVVLPAVDMSVRDLRDVETLVVEGQGPLRDAIKAAVSAWGGKAAHYSVLLRTPNVPIRKAFAVPAYHYVRFMEDNGLFARVDALLADPEFKDKPEVRSARLKELRDAIKAAPVDEAFQQALRAKIMADYPGLTMRFRTSTNSEDLEGFPCAGCYESHTGDPADWPTVLDAIRKTWASIWLFRTFEERAYSSIDHKSVVMALLVHHNFPAEEANGVAITANPFEPSGLTSGFYVNVQAGGEAEVVHPPPGVTSEEFIYHYSQPGQPVIYRSTSNLIPSGTTVLSAAQRFELGRALDAIHKRFSPAYGPAAGNNGWYAMDVEFKFDGEPGEVAKLFVKQARPYPGRGQ